MKAGRQDCILIFRLGSIGDTVVALPCFHAIARAYPRSHRVLLTNSLNSVRASSAESVLVGTGLIDETIYYPVGDFSLKSVMALSFELRRLHPASLIYLAERTSAAPVFRDLMFFRAAGIRRIVGAPWSRKLRTCRVEPATLQLEHEAERLARTLKGIVPVSLTPPNWDLRLSPQELVRADEALRPIPPACSLLAIAPGAKIAAKAWGTDNWNSLLECLAVDYNQVALVIVGAADERELGTEVGRRWRGHVLNLCGTLTPRETAAVLRRCQLMVCHDSGPMHLAASQETVCVALFGNLNRPRQWYPFGDRHRIVHEAKGIRAISVERVADEIRLALSSGPKARAGAAR